MFRSVRVLAERSMSALSISAVIKSGPGALSFFRLVIAALTSWNVGGLIFIKILIIKF